MADAEADADRHAPWPVLTFVGTRYEVGQQHGAALAEEIVKEAEPSLRQLAAARKRAVK